MGDSDATKDAREREGAELPDRQQHEGRAGELRDAEGARTTCESFSDTKSQCEATKKWLQAARRREGHRLPPREERHDEHLQVQPRHRLRDRFVELGVRRSGREEHVPAHPREVRGERRALQHADRGLVRGRRLGGERRAQDEIHLVHHGVLPLRDVLLPPGADGRSDGQAPGLQELQALTQRPGSSRSRRSLAGSAPASTGWWSRPCCRSCLAGRGRICAIGNCWQGRPRRWRMSSGTRHRRSSQTRSRPRRCRCRRSSFCRRTSS